MNFALPRGNCKLSLRIVGRLYSNHNLINTAISGILCAWWKTIFYPSIGEGIKLSRAAFLQVGLAVSLFWLALPVFAADGFYGDFTDDNKVDMNDLDDFCALWLVNDCNETNGVDLDKNCIVNFYEFSAFANNWRLTYIPNPAAPQNLMVPPMAFDDSSIILIWSKPSDYSSVVRYNVYKNGVLDGNTTKLFYNVTGLTAATSYSFTVKSVNASGTELAASNTCSKTTANTPAVFYPENYGAAANGTTKDTNAIQAAINACTAGGKVHLRAGKTFLSGAIFLKSNMTLQIDGTLLGSSAATDYPWTCWRFPYYASGKNYMGLINAYYDYNNPNSYGKPYGSITNVRICGSGVVNGCQDKSASSPHTITGHGITTLGTAEVAVHGDSSRGDLITIKGINQVYVGGWGGTLTLVYPAEHTIFVSYCNGVTVNAVNCDTYDIHNADGIDLCTSDTAYIFNSTFDTGDDCINMNAGQGQQGVDENVPDQNIRVFNCTTQRGHGGYVIGSFTAAWVQDSLIEDCTFSTSDGIGIRMKTGNGNGGGGRRITCRDIIITGVSKQGIFLDSTYDETGYTPAGYGQFSGNTFKNITVNSTGVSIFVNGVSGTPHTNNIFDHITGNKAASLTWCTNSTFNYCTVTSWSFTNCSGLSGTNNTPQPTWP